MTDQMSSTQVREALLRRWPSHQYLTIPEAPTSADRQGRKIDLVAVSLWASRGFTIEAVEIKVSMSDWRRELKDPEKADWWWRHADRFWVAAPSPIAAKIRPELPPGWGLLSVTETGVRATVQAEPSKDREPLPWTAIVGLLRAASGAGANALQRAWGEGRNAGWKAGQEAAQRSRADGRAERRAIEAFERASGIKIGETAWEASENGARVRMNERIANLDAVGLGFSVRSALHALEDATEPLSKLADALGIAEDVS